MSERTLALLAVAMYVDCQRWRSSGSRSAIGVAAAILGRQLVEPPLERRCLRDAP